MRFTGGAIAPFLAGKIAEHISPELPMLVGAAMVFASVVVLLAKRGVLAASGRPSATRGPRARRPEPALELVR